MPTHATQLQEPHSDSGDVLNISEQNSHRKVFMMFVQMDCFIYKCRDQKTKSLSVVVPTEVHQALELLLRQEQQNVIMLKLKLSKQARK